MNDSLWDIRQKIKEEKLATQRIAKSLKQWGQISSDVCTGVTNVSTSSHEWQIRFECQYQYNKTLMQQVQRMRAEIRMLRNGNELPDSLDTLKSLKTIGDWRKNIKELYVEKCSLKSLQNMYERQLDSESMVYHRVRDDLHKLTKDVRNSFDSRIHEQEMADRKEIPAIPLTNSPRKQWNKLKPIAHIMPIKTQQNKMAHNYTNIFQTQRQVEQNENRATFSGLVPVQPNPIPDIAERNPENNRVLLEPPVPLPERIVTLPKLSHTLPDDSIPIPENSATIPGNSVNIPEDTEGQYENQSD